MHDNLIKGKKIDEGVELKYYSDDEVKKQKASIPKPKTTVP